MEPTVLTANDLTPGNTLTLEQLHPDEALQSGLNLLGVAVSRPVALIIVAAGLFFIGVMIAGFAKTPQDRRCTLVSSPMSFLISSLIWVPLLNTKTIGVNFAPIDSFCAWVHGLDPTLGTLVSWGIVMALGALSCVIYNTVTTFGMAFFDRLRPQPPGPPQAPTPEA